MHKESQRVFADAETVRQTTPALPGYKANTARRLCRGLDSCLLPSGLYRRPRILTGVCSPGKRCDALPGARGACALLWAITAGWELALRCALASPDPEGSSIEVDDTTFTSAGQAHLDLSLFRALF